jgi:hypothetical protein
MTLRTSRRAAFWIAPFLTLVMNAIVALPASATDADEVRGYPARPVHLIVAFPAGTAVDGLARLVGSRLEQSLGQSVVVENRPGAGGNIGTTFAARAAPDGYTLGIIGASVTINPALHGVKVVDPARDFAPVIQLTAQPIVLVAHPSLPASTMSELIELARRRACLFNPRHRHPDAHRGRARRTTGRHRVVARAVSGIGPNPERRADRRSTAVVHAAGRCRALSARRTVESDCRDLRATRDRIAFGADDR